MLSSCCLLSSFWRPGPALVGWAPPFLQTHHFGPVLPPSLFMRTSLHTWFSGTPELVMGLCCQRSLGFPALTFTPSYFLYPGLSSQWYFSKGLLSICEVNCSQLEPPFTHSLNKHTVRAYCVLGIQWPVFALSDAPCS